MFFLILLWYLIYVLTFFFHILVRYLNSEHELWNKEKLTVTIKKYSIKTTTYYIRKLNKSINITQTKHKFNFVIYRFNHVSHDFVKGPQMGQVWTYILNGYNQLSVKFDWFLCHVLRENSRWFVVFSTSQCSRTVEVFAWPPREAAVKWSSAT
jgi:hypothetical protein